MFIKIYCYDKPVYLCDAITKPLENILQQTGTIFMKEINEASINTLLQEFPQKNIEAVILQNSDFEALKTLFFNCFTPIEAAGGIVSNEANELLFIFRLGKWDLPKGKVEVGENIEDTAVREIEEETGATNLTVHTKVGETYHTYHAFGKHFIKITHWFKISCTGNQQLVPQTEEDITTIQWIPINDIQQPLSNSYQNIVDIIQQYQLM